jgi:hypothetical protein
LSETQEVRCAIIERAKAVNVSQACYGTVGEVPDREPLDAFPPYHFKIYYNARIAVAIADIESHDRVNYAETAKKRRIARSMLVLLRVSKVLICNNLCNK